MHTYTPEITLAKTDSFSIQSLYIRAITDAVPGWHYLTSIMVDGTDVAEMVAFPSPSGLDRFSIAIATIGSDEVHTYTIPDAPTDHDIEQALDRWEDEREPTIPDDYDPQRI